MRYWVENSRNAIYDREFTSRKRAEAYIARMRRRGIEGRWIIYPIADVKPQEPECLSQQR